LKIISYLCRANQLKVTDMDKGQTHILKGILYEYGNSVLVPNGEIVAQGCEITEIVWNEETDELAFYAGDMYNDKYAEQVFPNETEMDLIYQYVVENF
jgi:hypothetical protein